MQLSDIFSFLSSGERKTLERIEDMIDISIESAQHLLSMTQDMKKYDFSSADVEFKKIVELEKQADNERRNLVRIVCSGSFFGGIREDLLTLLECVDDISDASKHAAEIFHDMSAPKDLLDYFFQEDVSGFLSICIDAAQLLKEAVKALEDNKDKVLATADQVEEKESEADDIHHAIVRHLFRNEINAKSLDIVLLKDFLAKADNIADRSEGGTDVLQILIAKGYS